MDMKRILQAMDGASSKPVEGVDSMSKFLSIINEGSNPHKVTLPVQMAMQHYQQPVVGQPITTPVSNITRESSIRKYFSQAETDAAERLTQKNTMYKQYAQTIAERVLMKEAANPAQQAAIAIAKKKKKVKESGVGPGMGNYVVDEAPLDFDRENPMSSTIHSHKGANPGSIEYRIMRARRQLKDLAEQAQSDDPRIWQHITKLFPELAMNIEQISHGLGELGAKRRAGGTNSRNIPAGIDEMMNDPCWKGYKMVGTKKKGSKSVPNCVPNKGK
jgi:hypothetical protein